MKTKRTKKAPQSSLLRAIEFVSLAQHNKGSEHQTHCLLSDYTATAFDGVIAACAPIEEGLEACPHTDSLALALARCGEQFAITQLSENRLQVRSGDFLGFVPCCERGKLPAVNSDAATMPISDLLIDSLRIVTGLANERADAVAAASILLRSGSAIATDLQVILEHWHGLSLPIIKLPKQAAVAIIKSGRKLVSLGYSEKSVTFHFEGGAWIKSQTYQEPWPDIDTVLNSPCSARDIGPEFFAAVKTVAPFSAGGNVWCGEGYVSSHHNIKAQTGGHLTLQTPNGLNWRAYNAKALLTVGKLAKRIDETALPNATLFFGDSLRGAIVHTVVTRKELECECGGVGTCDICLPF